EAWTFEGDSDWGGNTRTLKVGLMSYSEYIGYFGRFGLWLSDYNDEDPTGWEGWWLRTLRSNSKVFASFKNGGKADGTGIMGTLNHVNADDTNYHIRPTFHLSGDFFEDVKVDPATMGDKVKEILIENYTRAQLSSIGYTKDEISNIGSQVNSFAIYDSSDNEKANGSNITAGSAITAKASVNSNDLLSPVMFFAAYNGAELEGLQILNKASADTANGVTYYELTVSTPVSGRTYKAFLWDDLDNCMGLRKAITINCPTP
ncbi:MAG: hypothetical protein K5768_10445, partial [Firmicutes bacterium]|nr:hypothetical protein [Bacillota bacterium]